MMNINHCMFCGSGERLESSIIKGASTVYTSTQPFRGEELSYNGVLSQYHEVS